MDAFATSVSLALQHGVQLKVLCEKFAHTRFEPSGWTGNEQIGYAKSLMDYIFRWLNLRFLSGEQLALFAGLAPRAPQLPAPPSIVPETDAEEEASAASHHIGRLAEEVAKRLHQMSGPRGGQASGGGIAPEPKAEGARGSSFDSAVEAAIASGKYGTLEGLTSEQIAASGTPAPRGLYHAADAMRGMYEMGDAPSCSTCGAIMVRNGSCYRCMSCGSTSGCS